MTDAPQQPNSPGWKLVLDDGSPEGKSFSLAEGTTIIGRADTADISLDDARISRQHARLILDVDRLSIEDLNSFNGTLVNEKPVTGRYLLTPYDVITVGPFTFDVEGPTNYVPQVRRDTRAYVVPKAASRPKSRLPLLVATAVVAIVIAMLLVVLGVSWFLVRNWPAPGRAAATPTVPPPTIVARQAPAIVVNQVPTTGAILDLDRPVTIEATATDNTGVSRMELWVNGRKAGEQIGELPDGSASLTATWKWTPKATGDYNLEIRAYNQAGLINLLPVATVSVIDSPDTPTPKPTATPTLTNTPTLTATATPSRGGPSIPTVTSAGGPTATATGAASRPTATPTPAVALLTVTVPGLNVRTGPGNSYQTVGTLDRGEQAEILGQGSNGQGLWWQIRFDEAPGGLGWVSASRSFGIATNTSGVPAVTPAAAGSVSAASSTATPTGTPTPADTATPGGAYIRAPAGQALLIVSNRSFENQPARLTLSDGKSARGGVEVDVTPGQDEEIVLEPDFYRALWSSPARNNFTRGVDFTAGQDQVIVMWIKPEDGLTQTEFYDRLPRSGSFPTPIPTATPAPVITGYEAPPGKALLVVANRSITNDYGQVTVSGGSFGGGQEVTLAPGSEIPLELEAGYYRTVWTSPAYGGVTAGREFQVSPGEIILGWIIPEDREVQMQFPGREPEKINK